jgi:hypothetical protein
MMLPGGHQGNLNRPLTGDHGDARDYLADTTGAPVDAGEHNPVTVKRDR